MPEHNCSCEDCQLKSLFFSHVSEEFLDTICTKKQEKLFKKGELIISEGEHIKEFIYLKSGLVKLAKKMDEQKDQILCFAKPFDFVSLLSVFSSDKYNYSVTAIEESTICVLNLKDVKVMAQENGRFAIDLMKRISSATDLIILDNMEIKKKHLRGRIAHILLYFSNKIYRDSNFELPVSRREIAEYIGMTTENVIRTMSEFRKDKILKIYGKEIEIIDLKRLEDISAHG